jgi:hypothetical protein
MQWNYGSPGGKIELEVVPTSYSDGVYSRSGQNLLLRLRDRQGRLVKQWDVLYQSTGSIAGNPPCNLGSTIFDHYSLVIEDTPIPPYYEKPEDPDLDQRLEDACRKGESARPDGRSCDQFQIEVDIKKNQKTIETIADGIFWQEDMTPPYYHCQEIKEQICPDGQILCGSPSTGCCFDCGTASKKISRISENLNLILRRF